MRGILLRRSLVVVWCVCWCMMVHPLQRVHAQGVSTPNPVVDAPSQAAQGVCGIPALNPCISTAMCTLSVPVVGEAVCRCPWGYGGDGKRADVGGIGCFDIDECLSTDLLAACDDTTQTCVNTVGSYECVCRSGYRASASDPYVCLDVNECASGIHMCNQTESTCVNRPGGYECVCLDIHQVYDSALGGCRAIDPCLDMNGTLNPCQQKCSWDATAGVVTCGCDDGYKLHADGQTCEDIDECLMGNHSCDPHGVISVCENTMGSFRCECSQRNGYRNAADGRSCINYDECSADAYICGDAMMCCLDLEPPWRFLCLTPSRTQEAAERAATYALSRTMHPTRTHSGHEPPTAMEIHTLYPVEAYDPSLRHTYPIANSRSTPPHGTFSIEETLLTSHCFDYNTLYLDIDTAPPTPQVAYAAECQQHCATEPNCHYFTYDSVSQMCYKKATAFTAYTQLGSVSGPSACDMKPKNLASNRESGILSLGLTNLVRTPGGGLLQRRLSSSPLTLEATTPTTTPQPLQGPVDPQWCGGQMGQLCIIAGSLEPEAIWHYIEAYRNGTLLPHLLPNRLPNRLPNLRHLLLNLGHLGDLKETLNPFLGGNLLDLSHDKGKDNLLDLSHDKGYGNLLDLSHDKGKDKLLDLGHKTLLDASGSLVEITDKILSINPQSLFNGVCPSGFVHSADIARNLRRDQTLELARSAFVKKVNGTNVPVDPGDITHSLVQNTNYLANAFADWYLELASAPVEVATAAFTEPAETPITPQGAVLSPIAAPGSQPPETATTADRRAKANSALLTTLGLFSSLSGGTSGSPGLAADRSGLSRSMAYSY